MPMLKVDWNRVERELDPKYMTEDGIIVTPENYSKLVELGLIQDEKERKKAVRYNRRLLREFEKFVDGQKYSEKWKSEILSAMYFYADANAHSGCTLRFDDIDEEHFNYILYNRLIRKTLNMSERMMLSTLRSLGVFARFLESRDIKNYRVFEEVSKQKEKALERIRRYNKIMEEHNRELTSDEEFYDLTYELFGYDYLE
jgi:hypothetical protein